MGDRANVYIQSNGEGVYLYTHWGGSELPEIARVALAKNWRWHDPSYLARIVLDTMTEGTCDETGFGVWPSLGDNSYPIIVLDTDAQLVHFVAESEMDKPPIERAALKSFSFTHYIRLKRAAWPDDEPTCELCGEPADEGGAICPACAESR